MTLVQVTIKATHYKEIDTQNINTKRYALKEKIKNQNNKKKILVVIKHQKESKKNSLINEHILIDSLTY